MAETDLYQSAQFGVWGIFSSNVPELLRPALVVCLGVRQLSSEVGNVEGVPLAGKVDQD